MQKRLKRVNDINVGTNSKMDKDVLFDSMFKKFYEKKEEETEHMISQLDLKD